MRKLPIKSTDRGVKSDTTENVGMNLPQANTKARSILNSINSICNYSRNSNLHNCDIFCIFKKGA